MDDKDRDEHEEGGGEEQVEHGGGARSDEPQDITQLLLDVDRGIDGATEALYGAVEAQLKRIAGRLLRQLGSGKLLQVTLLVDDAFMALVGPAKGIDWESRRHFYNAASKAMRFSVINHLREVGAQKRGGDVTHLPIDDVVVASRDGGSLDLLDLESCLGRLEDVSERAHDVAQLRLMGYMNKDIVEIMGISLAVVERDFKRAREFLTECLRDEPKDEGE